MNPFLFPTVAAPRAACRRQPWQASPRPPKASRCSVAGAADGSPPAGLRNDRHRSALPRRQPARRQAGMASLGAALGVLILGLATMASAPAWALDVNSASAQQLDALKGIGPKTAEQIVAERSRGGPYESLQDLGERIRGLGAKRLQTLEAAGLTAGAAVAPGGGAATRGASAAAAGADKTGVADGTALDAAVKPPRAAAARSRSASGVRPPTGAGR